MAKKRAVPSPKQETLNIPSFLMNPVPSRVPDGAPTDQSTTRRQRPKRPKKVENQRILELEPEAVLETEPEADAQTSLELDTNPEAEPEVEEAFAPKEELEPQPEAAIELEEEYQPEQEPVVEPDAKAALEPVAEPEPEPEPALEPESEAALDAEQGRAATAEAGVEGKPQAEKASEADSPAQDAAETLEAQVDAADSGAEPTSIETMVEQAIDTVRDTKPEPVAEPMPKPEPEPAASLAPSPVEEREPEEAVAPTAEQEEPIEAAAKKTEPDTNSNDRPQDPLQRALEQEDELDAVMQTVFEAAGVPIMEEADDYAFDSIIDSEPEPAATPMPTPTMPEAAIPARVPSLKEDLAMLNKVERRLYAHRYASTELMTFGESIDPPKAAADRAEAVAVLVEEDHALLSKPEVGGMVERLVNRSEKLDPIVAKQVAILARDRRELVSVPASLQSRLVHVQTESYQAWLAAKANNDWQSFAPYLDRMVNLRRKVAEAIDPNADPYDTMLDMYEKGTNRAFYNNFFARVKQCVVPLLSSISMSGRTLSRTCIEGRFDTTRQWELAHDIMQLQGIDQKAHFLASTEHPFSDAMTSNYAITAARVVPDDVMSNVYTMLHELGHNLYEQGVDPKFNRTSLKGGTSMGMHESQSRLFENYIGRDRAFIPVLLSLLKQRFPGQMGRVTPNQLYRAVNRVVPSLIRMDADELTYPLHILVRYEIEQLLVSGKATARDVPRLWASRYSRYIGANVPDDTRGALQDVHWAEGDFGYFPTYALGNAYAAQMRAKMIDEGMDWSAILASGNLEPIRTWLRERVWQYGRSKDPADIIKDACGEPFTPRHYANYLTHKFAQLYSLH